MNLLVNPEEWQPAGNIYLEDAARRVVTSDTNTMVIAGPGAGKTELLAQRALYLLQTGLCKPPQRILAISFKRDAARALKDRVGARCSTDQARRFDSYTFDAFSKSLLDRFLALVPEWCRPPRDYRIHFPSRDDWDVFLQGLDPPVALGGVRAVRALRGEAIERWGPLPLQLTQPETIQQWVAVEWWRRCLAARQPGLTFAMIARLAEAILLYNPGVLRALRLTYSHVFLDEFQDTTGQQYALTTLAFSDSPAILTAVGDTKQRIMTWAGAETEVFSWFEHQFHARREMLQLNHRSNARIVQIINDLVKEIEPDAVETTCAGADHDVPEYASAFWLFKTEEEEARALATFISNDIKKYAEEGRDPDDFALLVRMRADQAEARLLEPFREHGLRLRNEVRPVGGVPIQDLLSDELVTLVLGLIRLALGIRGRDVYRPVQEIVGALLGIDFENTRDIRRLDQTVRNIISTIKQQTARPPADTNLSALVSSIVLALGETPLRRTFRQYEDERYFRNLQAALVELISEYATTTLNWRDLIDAVEGKGQVRLMTIHKSKGLEYHTVIFVGLHQRAFWGYRNNRAEETNNFFVALSRARERVYFTRSIESGDIVEIKGLIDLLETAKVPFQEF